MTGTEMPTHEAKNRLIGKVYALEGRDAHLRISLRGLRGAGGDFGSFRHQHSASMSQLRQCPAGATPLCTLRDDRRAPSGWADLLRAGGAM